jgi:hypothetical protein
VADGRQATRRRAQLLLPRSRMNVGRSSNGTLRVTAVS